MFQGFYNLTSGVLTQNRNLNVISNNMANTTTPGYKKDETTITTFHDTLISRVGNKEKQDAQVIGSSSSIVTVGQVATDYEAGDYEQTSNPMAFALGEKGFFCIQTNNGTVYTRNGNFSIDEQGYLSLPEIGRVLGENGPIYLGTDKIKADRAGVIRTEDGRQVLGKLSIVDFADRDTQLIKEDNGVFRATGAIEQVNDAEVYWKTVESSNVKPVDEMIKMMSSQRNLQSDLQMIKIYDQLIGKMVSSLGPTQ